MNIVCIGDISQQIRGVSYDKAEVSKQPETGLVPVLRANNIGNGEINTDDLVYVPSYRVRPQQYLIAGDVLIAASSGSIDVVGKAAPIRENLGAGFGAFCKVLRPTKQVWPSYFAHYFQTQKYRQIISGLAAGANINNLKNEHLDNLEIPLPPLPEQRRIAAVLDAADALRAKRRAALGKLDALLQSVFLEMFGDPVGNERGWEVGKLGKVGVLERGKSKHRPRNAPELLGGPYPLIQTGDIARANGGYILDYSQTYSEIGLKQSKMWSAGVLCITIAANIAESAVLTFNACFPDSVVGFLPNQRVKTEYVHYWLKFLKKTIQESAPQVAQKNINLEFLRDLEIPLPPIAAQEQFTSCVEEVSRLRHSSRRSEEKLERLFASLQQRAFRGEL